MMEIVFIHLIPETKDFTIAFVQSTRAKCRPKIASHAPARARSRLYNLIVYPKYPDKIKSPDDVLDDVARRRSGNVCNRVTLERRRAGNIISNQEPRRGEPGKLRLADKAVGTASSP